MKLLHTQRGVSIVFVVATILALSIIGVSVISLVATWSDVSVTELRSTQAYYIAQGGVEYGLHTTTRGGASWGRFEFVDRQLGDGNFTLNTYTSTVSGRSRMTLVSTGSVGGITDPPRAERKLKVVVER